MGLCKLRRVIPEQIRADVRLSGVIVGHGHMELRAAHRAMDAAVRLDGLLQIQCQVVCSSSNVRTAPMSWSGLLWVLRKFPSE